VSNEVDQVRRAAAGDVEAFSALVVRHEPVVVSVCMAVLGDEHEARDAAQDAFVRAYLGLDQLRDPRRVKAWLRRIAYSVCVNRLRKRAGRPTEPLSPERLDRIDARDASMDPQRRAEAREVAEAVRRSIDALPEAYREPIQLFYMDGLTTAAIAGRLGLRDGAVRTRLSRGRELLKPSLVQHWDIETLSRNKQRRRWLPLKLAPQEIGEMKLHYDQTTARLLRGDAAITVRAMTQDDIPAMRTFDTELTETIDQINAAYPPEGHSTSPGGPWSDDKWLAEHFDKYQRHGGLTLLALDDSGRIVGFADLWPTDEPDPFGASLNVECIDYFREYFLAGLETVLLTEAEKVALAAGLPALDIGTNTCSGEYVSLRRFGLKVFYEFDDVLCRCPTRAPAGAKRTVIAADEVDLAGLVRANHWSPTDFTFRGEEETPYLVDLTWPHRRAVVEFWRLEPQGPRRHPVPENAPDSTELFVPPEALTSSEAMTEILVECAAAAGQLVAEQIRLSCPSDVAVDSDALQITSRQFAFAWLRKEL